MIIFYYLINLLALPLSYSIEIIVKNNTHELKEIMKNELKSYIKSLKEESGSLRSEQEKKFEGNKNK